MFIKSVLCLFVFIFLFKATTYSQNWPLTFRASLACYIMKGRTTKQDTYAPPCDSKLGHMSFGFFYPDRMLAAGDVYIQKDRVTTFIRSFVAADSASWFPRMDIGFFHVYDSLNPAKVWWEFNIKGQKDTVDNEKKRFETFVHALPFETEARVESDSMWVAVEDVKGITPYIDDFMNYFNCAAAIFHYYVLHERPCYIGFARFHDGIITTYQYPKGEDYKKVFSVKKKYRKLFGL